MYTSFGLGKNLKGCVQIPAILARPLRLAYAYGICVSHLVYLNLVWFLTGDSMSFFVSVCVCARAVSAQFLLRFVSGLGTTVYVPVSSSATSTAWKSLTQTNTPYGTDPQPSSPAKPSTSWDVRHGSVWWISQWSSWGPSEALRKTANFTLLTILKI